MEPARPAPGERRLPAILAADVAEYSRLIGADEEGTLGRLRALCPRARLILIITSKSSAAASSKPRATACSSGPPASSTQWEYSADGMNL
jgi:hypothetical protein